MQKTSAPTSMTSPPSRQRILEYLRLHGMTSAQTLSRLWGLTRADIRYHLQALEKQGLIEGASAPPALGKRGRPARWYRLSANAAPNNLPALSTALLQMVMDATSLEEIKDLLQQLASRMADTPPVANLSATQRYQQAMSYLNQHGYHARWEARANGPQILLHNCPYAAILHDHPQLCILDRFLLERLTQSGLVQIAQMDGRVHGQTVCIFAQARPIAAGREQP